MVLRAEDFQFAPGNHRNQSPIHGIFKKKNICGSPKEESDNRRIKTGTGDCRRFWAKARRGGIRSSLDELVRLADTAQADVVATGVQFMDRPDPSWMIGRGKAEEIAQLAADVQVDLIIFNSELSPAQLNHLQELMPGKVIDRTRLILDIFAMRAKTKEGRLQVELAQLEYMLPRLSGRGWAMSRLGGGIGTRGPGEKKLETDRRAIRRRIRDLKRELDQVRRHRALHHARRRKMEMTQVALVGYTNAGKTTLLNRLTGAEPIAEDRLFATLDPASRFLRLPSKEQVLLTDTVGFIQVLPHELVAAFRSTLEQVTEADLLLHVVDASHPEADRQIQVVDKVLTDLGAGQIPIVTVLNKADFAPPKAFGSQQVAMRFPSPLSPIRTCYGSKKRSMGNCMPIRCTGLLSFRFGAVNGSPPCTSRLRYLASEISERTIRLDFRLPQRRFERLAPEVKALIRTR